MKLYKKEKKHKQKIFSKELKKLSAYGKPILLKLGRQKQEMNINSYLKIPVDGFTFSNSIKKIGYIKVGNHYVILFGKGSISGEPLIRGTLRKIPEIKKKIKNKYLSASGGIINAKSALQCLKSGADSIQVCSAIYLKGYKGLKEIAKAIKHLQQPGISRFS